MEKIEYASNGIRKDKLTINGNQSRLMTYESLLGGLLIIKVEDWPSMSVDRGNGEEEDYEYGSAAIILKRKQVKSLIFRLQHYLDETFDCDREGFHPLCEGQCDACKSKFNTTIEP